MGRETAVLAVVGGVVRSLVRIPRQTRSGRAALRGDLTQARDFCAKPEAGDAPSFHSNCSDCGLYGMYPPACMRLVHTPPAGALCSKGSRASAPVTLLAPEDN